MVEINTLNLSSDNHGEGIIWIHETNEIAWVEVFQSPKIRKYNVKNQTINSINLPGPISSFAPLKDKGFLVTMDGGFYIVSNANEITLKAKPKSFLSNEFLNDGRCDSKGRYLCASMDLEMKNQIGKLYQLDLKGQIRILDQDFIVGNGLAFSPNEDFLYVSDSRKDIIWRYDYNIFSGDISNKKQFFSTSDIEGRPDGAAIDQFGNYWSALFEGGAIICINHQTGKISSSITLPVTYPTMCCFGGKTLDELYVTTSQRLLSKVQIINQPLAGKIFKISNLGIIGLQSVRYSA